MTQTSGYLSQTQYRLGPERFPTTPTLSQAGSREEAQQAKWSFLDRPNQLVRAIQLDANPNGRKLNVDLDKSK